MLNRIVFDLLVKWRQHLLVPWIHECLIVLGDVYLDELIHGLLGLDKRNIVIVLVLTLLI